MSTLIQEFTADVVDEDGAVFTARARGELDAHGIWEGWVEFLPRAGGPPLRTGIETTQSHLEHLQYWASGLSPDYLESALRRANPKAMMYAKGTEPRTDGASRPNNRDGVRLEIETLDPHAAQRLMRRTELRAGQVRRIDGGGVLVYEGVEGKDGRPSRHRFRMQYETDVGASSMAHHIWAELQEDGAKVFVNGRSVPKDHHLLAETLLGKL
jgi:hypothetical protein